MSLGTEARAPEYSTQTETTKSDLADWEGPDENANPEIGKCQTTCPLVNAFTLYSNLAAMMFAPGAADLMEEFHVISGIVASFTVSIYLLGHVFGPFFLSSMSEIYGGNAVASSGLDPLLGPVIRPLIGGLRHRVSRMAPELLVGLDPGGARLFAWPLSRCERPTFGEDRTPAQATGACRSATPRAAPVSRRLLAVTLPGPFFCLIYLLFTTFRCVFETTYHFATDISGLAYLGLFVGMVICTASSALLSDKHLKQPRERILERPELCLILMIWSSPIGSSRFVGPRSLASLGLPDPHARPIVPR
ncbi:hypothetical protein BDW71DRAFT_207696 [Aspergillus fruticulosus]